MLCFHWNLERKKKEESVSYDGSTLLCFLGLCSEKSRDISCESSEQISILKLLLTFQPLSKLKAGITMTKAKAELDKQQLLNSISA